MKDKRPDPRPRKNPLLWQSYLWWDELVQLRKRHLLRISSIERGKSSMDAEFERTMMKEAFGINAKTMEPLGMDAMICNVTKTMIGYGKALGPVWEWGTTIKGLGSGSLLAQLLAQIDYPAPFPGSHPDHCTTISKLWRYAGWGVNDEGEVDRDQRGETSKYNHKLKATCWLIVDQFIKQQTPVYADLYYMEKARQRELYPEKIKVNGKWRYNDGHLHNRAIRKVAKIFLQHVWLVWRESEGLPISKPWVHDIGGHTNFVPPPNWPIEPCGI